MTTKVFRVPLGGSYNTRVSATNGLDSSSGYVGAGIVGLMIVGKTTSSTNKDQRFSNCFLTTIADAATGSKKQYARKRPGFAASNTPSSGNVGSAILVWTGAGAGTDVISAFGATNSTVYNGTSSLGAVTGKARAITETVVGAAPGTATLVVPTSDSTAWYYDTGVGVMTKITDGDFPGNAGLTTVGSFAHLDGYAIIMTNDGRIWASDLNSVTAWTATSFDTASALPDKGIGCIRWRNTIMCFGQQSIQFFQNAGLTPFPLSPVSSMTVKVGAVAADAIAEISGTIFWVGSSPEGGLSVYQFDGNVARVSTPEIDSLLILAGASNINVTTTSFYGLHFVIVNASTVTVVYCIEEKMWHDWSASARYWYKCAGVSIGGTMVNYSISDQSTSGKVYIQNQAALVFTDVGTNYTARMQLNNMDLGINNLKLWHEVELVADIESSSSLTTLSYSDDDYGTYTTWGDLDLSESRPRATHLGSSRRRAWALTNSSNTPMRIEVLQGRATICGS